MMIKTLIISIYSLSHNSANDQMEEICTHCLALCQKEGKLVVMSNWPLFARSAYWKFMLYEN